MGQWTGGKPQDTGATRRGSGIPLHQLNYLLVGIILVLAVFLVASIRRTTAAYQEVNRTTRTYMLCLQSAYDLREASDYLTEQVRSFTITGDRTYLERYFTEADETRRRDHALETLKTYFSGTEAYLALEEAMGHSVELMGREFYAMRLTAEANGYDLAQLPDEVRTVNMSTTDAFLSREGKAERARSMVFDGEYAQAKENISAKVRSGVDALFRETDERQARITEQLEKRLLGQHVLVVLLLLGSIAVALLTALLVIRPLQRAVEDLHEGSDLTVSGSREFRFLADTYNQMYEADRRHKEELTFAASHDPLTGLYNRSGYNELRQTLDLSSCALMAIDVDHFKEINDAYGHPVGDRALVRVANELRARFRAEDRVCRIGGDEFAVFMASAGPEIGEQIRAKVDNLNEQMSKAEGDLPPMSISAGVAFGSVSGERLFRNADAALYRAKELGRCRCEIFGEGK